MSGRKKKIKKDLRRVFRPKVSVRCFVLYGQLHGKRRALSGGSPCMFPEDFQRMYGLPAPYKSDFEDHVGSVIYHLRVDRFADFSELPLIHAQADQVLELFQ